MIKWFTCYVAFIVDLLRSILYFTNITVKASPKKNLIFFMAMMPFYLREKVQRPLKVIIFGDGTIRTLKSLYTFGRT